MARSTPTNQNGAALIVSLVILISITLLGITTMKQSLTELNMAGNLRQSEMAFQAAEVALTAGETALTNGNEPSNMIAENSADPDYLDPTTWSGTDATEANTIALANISISPRYVVKSLGMWDPDANTRKGNPGFGGYGQTSNAARVAYYRVTARGFAQTDVTTRTLQSFYGSSVKN